MKIKFLKEFKDFAIKGNMFDMAIGIFPAIKIEPGILFMLPS
jgi:hypothetical protein